MGLNACHLPARSEIACSASDARYGRIGEPASAWGKPHGCIQGRHGRRSVARTPEALAGAMLRPMAAPRGSGPNRGQRGPTIRRTAVGSATPDCPAARRIDPLCWLLVAWTASSGGTHQCAARLSCIRGCASPCAATSQGSCLGESLPRATLHPLRLPNAPLRRGGARMIRRCWGWRDGARRSGWEGV
jgi:hypothetical protein